MCPFDFLRGRGGGGRGWEEGRGIEGLLSNMCAHS